MWDISLHPVPYQYRPERVPYVGKFGKIHAKKEKIKLDHFLIPYTKINSKCNKDLNDRLKPIKILEKNIGIKISDIAHNNIFSDISPQVRETNKQNKQMGLHQTKKGFAQQRKSSTK